MLVKYFLRKYIDDAYPVISEKHCINYSTGKIKCRKCIEHCPSNALVLHDKIIDCLTSNCIGCGTCQSVCPSRSITYKLTHFNRLLNTAKIVTPLTIGCSCGSNDGEIKVSCFNWFTTDMLIILMFNTFSVQLNVSKCENCELKQQYDLFCERFDATQEVLMSLGVPHAVTKLNDLVSSTSEFQVGYSRRNFFSLIKSESLQKSGEVLKEIKQDAHTLPDDRSLLLKLVNALDKQGITFFPSVTGCISSFQVENNCSACGSCRVNCIRSAWLIKESKKTFELWHNASLCTGCNSCLDSCPQSAIKPIKIDVAKLYDYNLSHEKNKVSCKKCNNTFVKTNEFVELCERCKKHSKLKNQFI